MCRQRGIDAGNAAAQQQHTSQLQSCQWTSRSIDKWHQMGQDGSCWCPALWKSVDLCRRGRGSQRPGCQLTLCRAGAGTWCGPGEAQGALARQDWLRAGSVWLSAAPLLCSLSRDGWEGLVTALICYQQFHMLWCKLVSVREGGCQQG